MATEQSQASTDSEFVLETEGLQKDFGSLTAVNDVNLSIPDGELRSVIGPNGAGKTTLFNLISGRMEPTGGSVRFNGVDVTDEPPYERIKRGMGRSFQITNIFDGLTVEENVRLAVQSLHYDDIGPATSLLQSTGEFPEINERALDVVEQIGLVAHRDEIASTLSYGNQRRLEIGLVLATDPDLVLLDEPAAGISGEEVDELIELIDDVLGDKTLILVEHDVDLVMNISDSITVLNQGAVIAEGTPAEISDNQDVQEAYLGGHE